LKNELIAGRKKRQDHYEKNHRLKIRILLEFYMEVINDLISDMILSKRMNLISQMKGEVWYPLKKERSMKYYQNLTIARMS